MDLGSLFLILAVGLIVVVLLARPLITQDARVDFIKIQEKISEDDEKFSAYLSERDRILSALEELDTDFEMGKVPESEYPQKRAALLRSGAEILKQIDEINHQTDSGGMDDLEKMIAARRNAKKENGKAGFCPHCGNPIQENDKFCSACGWKVESE